MEVKEELNHPLIQMLVQEMEEDFETLLVDGWEEETQMLVQVPVEAKAGFCQGSLTDDV